MNNSCKTLNYSTDKKKQKKKTKKWKQLQQKLEHSKTEIRGHWAFVNFPKNPPGWGEKSESMVIPCILSL